MTRGPLTVVSSLLLSLFLLKGAYLIQATSPTTDEVAFHMVNGYTYLITHDYRMSPANPPLLRQWMALPWLLIRPKLDLDKTSWREADSVPFAVDFFYRDNRAIANQLLYSARAMNLILGFVLGWVVLVWARELYGPQAGEAALALYVFCPGLVAASAIAHTDIGVSLFCTASAYALWRYLEKGRRNDLWLTGVSWGLACAAKYNALIFGPVWVLIVFFRRGFKAAARLALILAVCALPIIWASYFFETKPILSGGVPRVEEKLGYVGAIARSLSPYNERLDSFLKDAALHRPMPMASYLLGLSGIVRSHHAPYRHYSFGRWTTDAVWYHYLFSFAVKMTLGFLVLLLLRAVWCGKLSSPQRHENWVVWVPAALLFWITSRDSTGVGVRYLFPVIPAMMVWAGGCVRLAAASRVWKSVVVFLLAAGAVSAVRVFPDYLSYFNESVGGVAGGHRYVRGSDVDWGQGLKALSGYVREHDLKRIKLDYFGTADPSFYGIPAEPIGDAERISPQAEVYAISLFYLEGTDWTHEIDPDRLLAGSIAVYDLRKKVKEV